MIISHRKKFAFFANQKTGSKAAGIMLRLSGVFDENDIMVEQPMPSTRTAIINFPAHNISKKNSYNLIHTTPQKAIDAGFITLNQLREYDCFAFLREPEERFLASRAAMLQNRNSAFHKPGKRIAGVPGPQYEFFFVGDEQVTTILDFSKFDTELKRMLDHIGSYKHMNMPHIMQLVPYRHAAYTYRQEQHTRDIQLYKSMLNNDV